MHHLFILSILFVYNTLCIYLGKLFWYKGLMLFGSCKGWLSYYGSIMRYDLGCPPAQDSSHHQDYYIFSRGSQPKPSFATGRGDNPRYDALESFFKILGPTWQCHSKFWCTPVYTRKGIHQVWWKVRGHAAMRIGNRWCWGPVQGANCFNKGPFHKPTFPWPLEFAELWKHHHFGWFSSTVGGEEKFLGHHLTCLSNLSYENKEHIFQDKHGLAGSCEPSTISFPKILCINTVVSFMKNFMKCLYKSHAWLLKVSFGYDAPEICRLDLEPGMKGKSWGHAVTAASPNVLHVNRVRSWAAIS